MVARNVSDIDQGGGVLPGEESATNASKLSGRIKCIIMQYAMAIVLRRPVSGKKAVVKLTRQALLYK